MFGFLVAHHPSGLNMTPPATIRSTFHCRTFFFLMKFVELFTRPELKVTYGPSCCIIFLTTVYTLNTTSGLNRKKCHVCLFHAQRVSFYIVCGKRSVEEENDELFADQ